jgi:hypothetical protein
MDRATMALAEAAFKAGLSNPSGDGAERAWTAYKPRAGYREALLREQLRELGFDVQPMDRSAGSSSLGAQSGDATQVPNESPATTPDRQPAICTCRHRAGDEPHCRMHGLPLDELAPESS